MSSRTWDRARPIVVAGVILFLFIFLFMLAVQIRQILAVLFLGVIVGVTLNPFVDVMARFKVPRVGAILLVYLFVAALLAMVTAYGVYQASQQDFVGELDQIRSDYDSMVQGTGLPSSNDIEDGVRSAAQDWVGGLAGRVMTVVSAFVGVVTILFTAILFSITQNRMRELLLDFFAPDRRERAEEMLGKYAKGLRGYARGEIIAMTTIGVVTFIGLTIIGVPLAVPLAFIAFLFELFPMIGPWIALIPALIVGFTQGTWVGLQVLGLYLVIQAFESYILTPMVHSRESEVPAFLIFGSVLFGGALMGILGALVALPVAILLHITYFELVRPWNRRRFGEVETVTEQEPVEEEAPAEA